LKFVEDTLIEDTLIEDTYAQLVDKLKEFDYLELDKKTLKN
jgi:hypothetical protein